MSNAIFPELPGLKWDTTKKPKFSTRIHEATSGKEYRASYWTSPKWYFGLSYEVLDETEEQNDLRILGGFFLARKGRFDSFLYRDETDCSVTDQAIGTGDGTRTSWQLVRSFGEFTEPIKNIDGTPEVFIDGAKTGYTISTTGVVTFAGVPGAGAKITANFNYFFRCRFDLDEAEFSQFMQDLWELKKMEMVSLK